MSVILVMVLGAIANRICRGWCILAILGIATSFGATPDRDLGARECLGSSCSVGGTNPGTRGPPPTADALGGVTYSAPLVNSVVTMEILKIS